MDSKAEVGPWCLLSQIGLAYILHLMVILRELWEASISKVQIFWEGHKICKKSPTIFYVLFLLYVLVDFFPDWINYKYWTISIKIHHTGFFYYYTTLPIIHTDWKISLHTPDHILVDLKNMDRNIYKTSTYNMNVRVSSTRVHQDHDDRKVFLLHLNGAKTFPNIYFTKKSTLPALIMYLGLHD